MRVLQTPAASDTHTSCEDAISSALVQDAAEESISAADLW